MRLRLTVQRNCLPAANILWNVPDTNSPQAYTITRLLEDVNHVIPLEGEHWGLEHYVVEVGGFECLHFSPVSQALKEDDHVSIRPIMTAEERARTLTGRHQISNDGRHLVDGVPFGRPYLRHPRRPAVRIPPRKRQRLTQPEERTNEEEVEKEFEEMATVALALENGNTPSARAHTGTQRPSKKVQFTQSELDLQDDSEDDEDDDEDFALEAVSKDDVSMDDNSDDESEDDADSDPSSSGSDSSDSDSDSESDSDSDSGSEGESDASSPPDVLSSKDGSKKKVTSPPKHVAPGEGLTSTRSRNARRTMAHRLRHLKNIGQLPENADLSALRQYEAGPEGIEEAEVSEPSQSFNNYTGKRKRQNDAESPELIVDDTSELEQRKRELMARFSETPRTMAPVDTPAQPQSPITEPSSTTAQKSPDPELPTKKETPSRRLRPDTSAISRILARQTRPVVKKAKAKPVAEGPPEPEGASDPDFWKTRINLSAFECWEEDFELTTPPFPFKQHWDPASRRMRDKVNKKKKGGRVETSRESLPTEDEEEKIVLNYDDAPAAENPDAEISAAIEDQLRQDVATAAQSDIPSLPDDINSLPTLTSSDIKQGAIIVCKFFAVNPVTITPEISGYKTAVVEREGDSGNGAGTIQLKIAMRDLPKRERRFDSNGNRVYGAAHAFLMENDDEEDEDLWEGHFTELLEPKLLKAA